MICRPGIFPGSSHCRKRVTPHLPHWQVAPSHCPELPPPPYTKWGGGGLCRSGKTGEGVPLTRTIPGVTPTMVHDRPTPRPFAWGQGGHSFRRRFHTNTGFRHGNVGGSPHPIVIKGGVTLAAPEKMVGGRGSQFFLKVGATPRIVLSGTVACLRTSTGNGGRNGGEWGVTPCSC